MVLNFWVFHLFKAISCYDICMLVMLHHLWKNKLSKEPHNNVMLHHSFSRYMTCEKIYFHWLSKLMVTLHTIIIAWSKNENESRQSVMHGAWSLLVESVKLKLGKIIYKYGTYSSKVYNIWDAVTLRHSAIIYTLHCKVWIFLVHVVSRLSFFYKHEIMYETNMFTTNKWKRMMNNLYSDLFRTIFARGTSHRLPSFWNIFK